MATARCLTGTAGAATRYQLYTIAIMKNHFIIVLLLASIALTTGASVQR